MVLKRAERESQRARVKGQERRGGGNGRRWRRRHGKEAGGSGEKWWGAGAAMLPHDLGPYSGGVGTAMTSTKDLINSPLLLATKNQI